MTIEYYINGYKFSDGGVYISESEGIIGGLKMKTPTSVEWPDHHGSVIDLSAPRYEARDIKLKCFIKTSSKEDFLEKAQAFMDRFKKAGLQRLMIVVNALKPLIYEVYCADKIEIEKTWNDGEMIGTFTLNLDEPEPVKRIYKYTATSGALSVSFAITTTEPVNIYWGDGSVTYDVTTDSGTITHAYAAAGTYYINITGVIEDITGITTGATLIWNKL